MGSKLTGVIVTSFVYPVVAVSLIGPLTDPLHVMRKNDENALVWVFWTNGCPAVTHGPPGGWTNSQV
jgi:hypothetical protein